MGRFSRRSPYPADLVLSGQQMMLGRPKEGVPLVATKPQDTAQVQPLEYGLGAQNPLIERVHIYDDFSLGYGWRIQQQAKERRYYYALGADCSVAGHVMKGPLITTLVPGTRDTTNGISGFFEIGGFVYALNGRYALKLVSDASITVSRDFGSGKAAFDGTTFFTNVSGGVNLAYVGMGDAEKMWKFDGTTWTQHATLFARSFVAVGREFWRSYDVNHVGKVDTDADPWLAANWTAPSGGTIGDRQFPINRLALSGSRGLLIFKTDGVYSLDESDVDNPLYPFLKQAVDPDNGKAIGAWINDVYVAYRDGTFRIHPDYGIEEIGAERLTNNDSPVRGKLTALCGHDTFNLYAAIWNEDTGNAYVLKFGSWLNLQQPPDWLAPAQGNTTTVRIEAWHGSISQQFSGAKITSLYRSTIGAPTNHARMYIGFADGTVGWFTLPCTPNPVACTEYDFGADADDGVVYIPRFHAQDQADPKVIKAVTITGTTLDTDNWAELQYRTAPTAAWQDLGLDFTQTTQKVELRSGATGVLLDFALFLKTDGGRTPVVTALGIHHAVRPPFVLVYECLILCDQLLVKRDGAPLRATADQLRTVVRAAAAAAGPVLVTLPDSTTQNMAVVGYEESQAWDERLRHWSAAIKVQLVPFQNGSVSPSAIYGTYARLGVYTYGALSAYSYGQLANL